VHHVKQSGLELVMKSMKQVLKCEKINQYPVGIDSSHGPTQKPLSHSQTQCFMHCNVPLLKVSQLKACVREINTALDTAAWYERTDIFLY